MSLAERVVRVPILGLDGQIDPKGAPAGRLDLAENVMANRLDGGGPAIEIEKRNGFTSLSTSILGGGSLSAGAKVQAIGDELVVTDGGFLYTWAAAQSKWVKKGKVTDLAATVTTVAGAPAALSFPNLDCDVAYANGYLCFTCAGAFSTDDTTSWFMQEVATGAIVGSGHLGTAGTARKLRVVAVGTVFFLFYWDGTNTLICRKIDTATPATISAGSNVATNLNTTGFFDVIADVTNSRMVVAYRNTTPTLTLMIWNTGMTAGTAVAYATRDPDATIGFLDYSFVSGNGYVAIGTTATGVRLLTFGASSMTVTVDTVVDGAVTNAKLACGYFSTVANVFYSASHIQGWSNGTPFMVQRGAELGSRALLMNGKRYLLASYRGASASIQQSLFLLELEVDTAGAAAGAMVAGHLIQGNASNRLSIKGLGCLVAVSSTVAVAAWSLIEARQAPNLSISVEHSTVARITLDWSGTLTGAPVAFNGVLYFPGAAPKVYAGQDLQEVGFYVYPEAPTLTPTVVAAATAGTYQYRLVYSKIDNAGKVHRSAPSPIASITVNATQGRVTIVSPTLRLTDTDPAHNTNPLVSPVNIEIYRTEPNGSQFFLYRVLTNDPTVDSLSLDDNDIESGILGEEIYTDTEAAGHVMPAAILAFGAHRDRLFAMTSDTLYPSTDVASGDAVAFDSDTDGFFLEFDRAADGSLVGLVSDGATLFIGSRRRVYMLQGEGPGVSGNDGYQFPSSLPSQTGFSGPRGFVATPDGIILQTPKGKHLLDRAGGIQPIPGADAYDALTVTGGVALDDRPYACLTTSNGTTLVWDWQLKQWYTWTGQAAVACCRWQNTFAFVDSAGKVWKETPGAYSDDGTATGGSAAAIQEKVRFTWMNFGGTVLGFQRIWLMQLLGEFMGSTTVNLRLAYDLATALTSYAKAVTVTTLAPLELKPVRQECRQLQVTVDETSTTAGFKLSGFIFLAGVDGRVRPVDPAQRMT